MPLQWAEHGGVLRVSLDAPPVNALSVDLLDAFDRVIDDAGRARALIIDSAVPGRFSAGADLKLIAGCDRVGFDRYLDRLNGVLDHIAGLAVPSIAVVDGAALGGGMELALACDLRVAGPDASFALPEVRLGLMPGAGGVHRLAGLVARPVLVDMLLTGRALDCAEALRWGVVQYVSDGPDDFAASLAESLAAGSPDASRVIKRCVDDVTQAPQEGPSIERDAVLELFATPNGQEGVAAFLARRRPEFAR